MTAKQEKGKIVEIFYDEHGCEIKPSDRDYDEYLNGDRYFGSYFVDEEGRVIKTSNPNRVKTPLPCDNEKKKINKTGIIILIIAFMALVAAIIFVIIDEEKKNAPIYEVSYFVSNANCEEELCSTTSDRISIELDIGGQITKKIDQIELEDSFSKKTNSCKESGTKWDSNVRKYKCTGVNLSSGLNHLNVNIITKLDNGDSSIISAKTINIKHIISIEEKDVESYDFESSQIGAHSDMRAVYLKNFDTNDMDFKQRIIKTLREDNAVLSSNNILVYVYSDEMCFHAKIKDPTYVCEDAGEFVALYEVGGKDESLHGLEFFPNIAEGDKLYQYKEFLKGSL